MDTLQHAIDLRGGLSRFADALGTTMQRVGNWRSRGRVPADVVLRVAAATDWQVTPHDLRPDIYPNPDDGLPPELRQAAKDEAA